MVMQMAIDIMSSNTVMDSDNEMLSQKYNARFIIKLATQPKW